MKNYKDMYPENMIINHEHGIDEKVRMLRLLFKQRKLNYSICYSDGWVIIFLTRKNGVQESFFYHKPKNVFYIFYFILTYLKEHGGIEQWQIPKN